MKNSKSANELAKIYINGEEGIEKNIQKAIEFYEKGVQLGNSDSMYELGFIYDKGEFIQKDNKMAIHLYEKAVRNHHIIALIRLKKLYKIENMFKENPKLKDHFIKPDQIKIKNKIGNGGYSNVFEGEWNDKSVAIKRIESKKMSFKSFKNEAEIMLKINHPNIVKCLAWGRDKDYYYMVLEKMEYNLLDLLKVLTRNEKLSCLYYISNAMHFLSLFGPIHSDIKCENILLLNDDIKIADFGLSYEINDEIEDFIYTFKSKFIRGTLRYMAPELLSKEPLYSEKSDVYAFSMIIYSLFEEKEPEQNFKDIREAMEKVNSGERPKTNILDQKINKDIKDLMIRCWDKDPQKRPKFFDYKTAKSVFKTGDIHLSRENHHKSHSNIASFIDGETTSFLNLIK